MNNLNFPHKELKAGTEYCYTVKSVELIVTTKESEVKPGEDDNYNPTKI